MSRIPVAVLGATGYAGEGAVRILLGHPGFRLVHVGSDRLAGTPLAEAVPALAGETDLVLGADTPEIVQSLAVALSGGATKAQFDRTIAMHPTAAEEFVLMRTPTRTA